MQCQDGGGGGELTAGTAVLWNKGTLPWAGQLGLRNAEEANGQKNAPQSLISQPARVCQMQQLRRASERARQRAGPEEKPPADSSAVGGRWWMVGAGGAPVRWWWLWRIPHCGLEMTPISLDGRAGRSPFFVPSKVPRLSWVGDGRRYRRLESARRATVEGNWMGARQWRARCCSGVRSSAAAQQRSTAAQRRSAAQRPPSARSRVCVPMPTRGAPACLSIHVGGIEQLTGWLPFPCPCPHPRIPVRLSGVAPSLAGQICMGAWVMPRSSPALWGYRGPRTARGIASAIQVTDTCPLRHPCGCLMARPPG